MEWHFPGAQQRWAHSCCSQNALKAAFKDSQITAIEADILMGFSGGGNSEIPIMAHPPTKTSDLTFQEFWQQCVEEARHHLKLDFKDLRSLQLCLPHIRASQQRLLRQRQGLWINADVLPGPNRRHERCPVPAEELVKAVKEWIPGVPVSLGWRVAVYGSDTYTSKDVSDMLRVCDALETDEAESCPVVFAVSARLALRQPTPLVQLLKRKTRSQLLVWTGTGEPPLHAHDLEVLKENFHGERVGFDCQVAKNSLEQVSNGLQILCLAGVRRLVSCWDR